MAGEYFTKKFGKNPKEFKTANEVDDYIMEKTGKRPLIKKVHSELCSTRGKVFESKKLDANKIIDAALGRS